MTDLNPLSESNGTPDDVATLYSWANLHGAKYRDFSAARAQTREKARLRAQLASEAEQQRGHAESQTALAVLAAEPQNAAEEAHAADVARRAEFAAGQAAQKAEWESLHAVEQTRQAAMYAPEQAAHKASEQAAQRVAKDAAEQAARIAAEQASRRAAQDAADRAAQYAAAQADSLAAKLAERQAAEQAAEQAAFYAAEQEAEQSAQQRAWQKVRLDRFPSSASPIPEAPYASLQSIDSQISARPRAYRPTPHPMQYPPREEDSMPLRNPQATPNEHESVGRPAWLSADRPVMPSQSFTPSALPQAPQDTLQGSRDRMTTRWFALRGIFDGDLAPVEAIPAPVVSRAPAMAVFSLAGGVGKTSLVATLGRALSARGERVLLVDTAAFGLLPFFFGASDQRPGLLRTFTPPGVSSDAPIQMVTIDPDGVGSDIANPESLSGEIAKFSRGVSRVIVDLATASGATTRRIMRMSPLVLVPVIPDMNSVVSVSSIDAFFEHNSNPSGKPALPFYVLNQFDASLPLHLDVREVLREQLGDRLLPFALRRAPAMSEALAEGMTVMDYAPNSPLAEDFFTLAAWVKNVSAPATTSYRGVRWSER